jgi:hypothetical protein
MTEISKFAFTGFSSVSRSFLYLRENLFSIGGVSVDNEPSVIGEKISMNFELFIKIWRIEFMKQELPKFFRPFGIVILKLLGIIFFFVLRFFVELDFLFWFDLACFFI